MMRIIRLGMNWDVAISFVLITAFDNSLLHFLA
jgi:hypothetical protein